ncbi:hypothetical protein LEMLEM_LOCUS12211 [Lemmus lemmus]
MGHLSGHPDRIRMPRTTKARRLTCPCWSLIKWVKNRNALGCMGSKGGLLRDGATRSPH